MKPQGDRAGSARATASAPPIRLSLVDDHPALVLGLTAIFSSDARYRVVRGGISADDAATIAQDGLCDVILLDLGMPGDVFGALGRIASVSPAIRVVVFTAHDNVDLAVRALGAGAIGYVLKGSPAEELHDAIAAAVRNEVYVSPAFATRVLAGLRKTGSDGTRRLSGRERQLVACLLEGKSNKEIAAALALTEKTVKHYMTNLMAKLQVRSRLEVVIAAQRWANSPVRTPDAPADSPPLVPN